MRSHIFPLFSFFDTIKSIPECNSIGNGDSSYRGYVISYFYPGQIINILLYTLNVEIQNPPLSVFMIVKQQIWSKDSLVSFRNQFPPL